MDTGTQASINKLLKETDMTNEEIINRLDITYGMFYSLVNRTEVDERDANIRVYKFVGHNGKNKKDKCSVCGIILLKDYSVTPENWGEFQRQAGNICSSCLEDISNIFPDAMKILRSSGCLECGKDSSVYFYTRYEVSPSKAVPLCKEHEDMFYQKKFDDLLRVYHGEMDHSSLFNILSTNGQYILPGWDDMYICDQCGYMSAWANMLLMELVDDTEEYDEKEFKNKATCPSCEDK